MSDNIPQTAPAAPPPNGVGQDVVLPRAVRRAAQRAAELQKELIEGQGEALPEQPPVDQQQPRLPLGDAPVEPPAQPQQDSYEQRYRTLQGKYDSEMPALKAQVSGLERLIATMRDNPPQQQTPPPAPSEPAPAVISEDDIAAYGPELIEASRRWAAAEVQRQMASVKAELAQVKGSQTKSAEDQLRERVQRDLDNDPELAGRWRELNTNQEFLNWLQGLDPFSGLSRFVMLQNAYSGGDAMRTGRFFKAYIAEHTVPSQQPYDPQTALSGNGQVQAGDRRLAEWATPGRAAGNSYPGNGATAERRVWTNTEIKQFYRELTAGKFRGREPEAIALETDILAAGREGRVRNV